MVWTMVVHNILLKDAYVTQITRADDNSKSFRKRKNTLKRIILKS